MDLTESTAPRSDQQNYDAYLAGPRTVTIEKVTAGNDEQPVDIHLAEFPGRPYKPSKSMRRVLVAAWGPQSANYAGRRMTLYGDPDVKFGGIVVGGIKISHLSHIDKTLKLALTVSKGKRAAHIVEPLVEAPGPSPSPPEPTAEQVATSTDLAQLRAMYRASGPDRQAQIKARVAELTPTQDTEHGPVDTTTDDAPSARAAEVAAQDGATA